MLASTFFDGRPIPGLEWLEAKPSQLGLSLEIFGKKNLGFGSYVTTAIKLRLLILEYASISDDFILSPLRYLSCFWALKLIRLALQSIS